MAYLRGLDEIQEQDPRQIVRDTRTLSRRFITFIENPKNMAVMYAFFALTAIFFPGIADIVFLIGLGIFLFSLTRKSILPFRLPVHSEAMDYNDPIPGTRNKPNKARGIYFFGNDAKSNEELWFANEDMRTHVLIFGSTGSGKTEALVSMAYNALLQASGFIYVDGKGDNSLFAKMFSMVRSMGREDDMLLINFMTGARDIIGPQAKRLSNTMNPFSDGSSSMLAQLVVSLMDGSSSSSDGDMWKGRAIGFVEAIMRVLVAMRDSGYILLDANSVRNYFLLDRIESMVIDKLFIRDGQEAVNLDILPSSVLEPIENYLYNLPGYNKAKKGKQVSQVLEQHGFITMQLTRVFTSLADTYGHIMRTRLAEVDMKDVVLNRRILVVLLPALEKSPDELSNLGKVIIASLRAMMAAGLGDSVEGDFKNLISTKPTNSKTPYLCILDEYGYYAVQGFSVVPAQARSLGFSVVFAGQDLPAFQKASKEEAASIGANTNIKICMKLEDPMETWEFFQKTAGESYVSHIESFQVNPDSPLNHFRENAGARMEKRARIDLLDLKEQREGEAHVFFKSKIVRAKMFYANPKNVSHIRLNHFVKVDAPSDESIKRYEKVGKRFEAIAKKGELSIDIASASKEIEHISQVMSDEASGLDLIELSIRALHKYTKKNVVIPVKKDVSANTSGTVNLFMAINEHKDREQYYMAEDIGKFKKPQLYRSELRDQIEYVERLSGRTSQQSTNVAMELVRDMQKSTHYPPPIDYMPDLTELSQAINTLSDDIKLKKEES